MLSSIWINRSWSSSSSASSKYSFCLAGEAVVPSSSQSALNSFSLFRSFVVIVVFGCVCFSRDAISPKGRKTQVLASNFQVSSIVCFQITTAPCTLSVYVHSFFSSIFLIRFVLFHLCSGIPWRSSTIAIIERMRDCGNIRNLVNVCAVDAHSNRIHP